MPGQPTYAEAVWPNRHSSCGLRLRPHTCGHALLLHRLESPYAVGVGKPSGLGDTIQAAWVCSRHWRAAARGLNRWWWPLLARWTAARRSPHELEDTMGLIGYLEEAWRFPKMWREQTGGGNRGANVLHLLVVTQRRRWGKSLRQALNTPVAEAVQDHCEFMEESRAIRLWGAQDEMLAARLDAVLAAEQKEARNA